mgnify:CR=1 FL=1
MDTHLTDLDALALTIRDSRSKVYIDEAIYSYRAGAYRASIVATYVAVTFDLIMKIREIAAGGDADAVQLSKELDVNIEANNTQKLLKIEGTLIEESHARFQLVGPQEKHFLIRLKDDRHLCAHPAFSAEGELFKPTPDLVRSHIVHAIAFVLSQPPIQGKAVLNIFTADVASTAFPNDREKIIHYMIGRYLSRMRDGLAKNLTSIIIKGLIQGDQTGWLGKEQSLGACLEAIERHCPTVWSDVVKSTAKQFLPSLSADRLMNAIGVMAMVPQLWEATEPTVHTRCLALIENWNPLINPNTIFSGISLVPLQDALLQAITRAQESQQLQIINDYPHIRLIDPASKILEASSSYRGAEQRFLNAVIPLANYIDAPNIEKILEVVKSNGQIWNAGGIPSMLANLAAAAADRKQLVKESWLAMLVFGRSKSSAAIYEPLEAQLIALGIQVPPA